MASGTHFYLNWAKERIDEMDAVLTSLESKANEVAAESRSAAEKTIAELRDKRNTFFDDMKKQAETSEGAWLQAKARLESEWESFQADARKYVEGVGQQLKQQQTTFQDVAAAQLKAWRAAGVDHPVLILTSRGAWTEKVEGLNAGADDYLAKPFETGEVTARLHALIRRRAGRADPVLRRGDIELRPAEGVVKVDSQTLQLTGQELRILMYLMQRPGRIVSEQDIAEHIYSLDDERQSNSVQVYISRLRRKLGKDTIRTFRGLGYRFS